MLRANLLRAFLAGWAVTAAWAGTFGKVVQIGGHVSDVALDERRGLVYVANFTANRIEVVHATQHTRLAPLQLPAPQPGAIALSPDGRYLVVTHFADWVIPVNIEPGITVLDLDAHLTSHLELAVSPLAVGFGSSSLALVVCEDGFRILDPATGIMQLITTATMVGSDEPVPLATMPLDIVRASLGVSGDKQYLVGVAGIKKQELDQVLHFRFNVTSGELEIIGITAAPPIGPRVVSVDRTGDTFLIGWALFDKRHVVMAQFPYPTGHLSVGGHAFDWSRSLIYAQIPEETYEDDDEAPPVGQPPVPPLGPPVLHIVDADNLTVRERLQLPENLSGKGLIWSDNQTMYAASDSGLMILPIGSLNQQHRVTANKEDVLFRISPCETAILTQEIEIVDPGGGNTDFNLSVLGSGVSVSPSSGATPATVQVSLNVNTFQNLRGTATVTIEIASGGGINIPMPVRVLINNREPDQRGSLFNIPGKLVDVLPDPIRNRFYVLRQDKNQVQVYNAATYSLVETMRTGNTPTQMAFTADHKYLIVGNDNSQIANVLDLDLLEASDEIVFPFGDYPRSIAVSENAILGAVRGVGKPVGCPNGPGQHTIDRVDFATRTAMKLPSLGVYCNDIPLGTVLIASPDSLVIFGAMDDGNTLLYEADADTFVASRKDFDEMKGAIAAVTGGIFVVDNVLLNGSLVPTGTVETATGSSSGFTLFDNMGLRTTAPSASGVGVIQRVDLSRPDLSIRPTKLIEAPLLVASMPTPPVGQIGQTILPFTRALMGTPNGTSIVSLSTSGFIVLPWNFDAPVAKPVIQSVVNLADGTTAIASGGLIAVAGTDLSRDTISNTELPVPRTLGEACLSVNGFLAPLFMVSPSTIHAQVPFEVAGSASFVLRTAGGTSDPFTTSVATSAPAVFHTGVSGPETGLPAIFRAMNYDLVTLSNPVHPGDYLAIFLTGLGRTSPDIPTGEAGPFDPLAIAVDAQQVTLGGVNLPVLYAGLVPGLVGVYQINVYIPEWVPRGMDIPMNIGKSSLNIEYSVRVVK